MTLRQALAGLAPEIWTDGAVSIRPLKTEADIVKLLVNLWHSLLE